MFIQLAHAPANPDTFLCTTRQNKFRVLTASNVLGLSVSRRCKKHKLKCTAVIVTLHNHILQNSKSVSNNRFAQGKNPLRIPRKVITAFYYIEQVQTFLDLYYFPFMRREIR